MVTFPPLRKNLTSPENAMRAKSLINWLKSKQFKKPANLFIFDLFSLLADDSGYLKQQYCRILPIDSHPNKEANKAVSPQFAEFLASIVQ